MKRDKIRALKLDNDEWQRVSTFLGLLAVCTSSTFLFQVYNKLLSMSTTHSKHFHQIKLQLSIWLSRHLKPFTGHGQLVLDVQSMSALSLRLMWHLQRSMNIMKRLRIHLRIL